MSIRIKKSTTPATDYFALIQRKYGNSIETDRYISETQEGLSIISATNEFRPIFFHAFEDENLIGHIGLIQNSNQEAFFGFFEIETLSCFKDLWQTMLADVEQLSIKSLFGPVNGTVWHPYRVISETSDEPYFLCEPHSDSQYHALLSAQSPDRELKYHSAFRKNYDVIIKVTTPSLTALEKEGITISKQELTPKLLGELYSLATQIFSNNPGYTDLPAADFENLYKESEDGNSQNLIFLAYKGEDCIGFSYNICCKNELIMKTIGVLPEWQEQGLGNALVNVVHKHATENSMDKVIYALIRSDNKVRHFPKDDVTIFRRYSAFLYLFA